MVYLQVEIEIYKSVGQNLLFASEVFDYLYVK